MRRPLDWIVVSISVLVLIANRMTADDAPPEPIPAAARVEAPTLVVAMPDNPFAYIREDGTQWFVSPTGPGLSPRSAHAELTPGNLHAIRRFAQLPDSRRAVYSWTSPISASSSSQ